MHASGGWPENRAEHGHGRCRKRTRLRRHDIAAGEGSHSLKTLRAALRLEKSCARRAPFPQGALAANRYSPCRAARAPKLSLAGSSARGHRTKTITALNPSPIASSPSVSSEAGSSESAATL